MNKNNNKNKQKANLYRLTTDRWVKVASYMVTDGN